MLWLQDLLLLVGPHGDWVNLSLDEEVVLVQEVDGTSPPQPLCSRSTVAELVVCEYAWLLLYFIASA